MSTRMAPRMAWTRRESPIFFCLALHWISFEGVKMSNDWDLWTSISTLEHSHAATANLLGMIAIWVFGGFLLRQCLRRPCSFHWSLLHRPGESENQTAPTISCVVQVKAEPSLGLMYLSPEVWDWRKSNSIKQLNLWATLWLKFREILQLVLAMSRRRRQRKPESWIASTT